MDRYYEEESNARGGLFTPGGASAGGIFGDGQVVTREHDGPAAHRHLGAVAAAADADLQNELRRELALSRRINEKLLDRLERLEGTQPRGLKGRSRGKALPEPIDDDLDDDELDDDYIE